MFGDDEGGVVPGEEAAAGAPGAPGVGGGRRERTVLAVLVAMVVLPVLGTGIRMVLEGWYPTFDDAVITNRAFDVFSRHSPIVGQFSLAGSTGPSTHSPGPMLFWWLAIPARIGPTWAMPLWAAAGNAACFAGVVLLARRRGGLGLASVSAVGCLVLLRALGPASMAEVWNPWTGLVPLLLLVFLVWSILDGDRALLPLAVLVGSFTMQGHLSVLFPSVALLAVAVVGGWGPDLVARLGRRRSVDRFVRSGLAAGAGVVDADGGDDRRTGDERGPAGSAGAPPRGPAWRPLVLAVLVGIGCWAVPVYEEVTGDPGNLTLLLRSSGEEGGRGGLHAVRAAVWHSLGVPPIWLRGEQDPLAFATKSFAPVGWAQAVNVLAVVALGAWLAVLARRRRDRLVLAALAVAGALVAGMVFTALTIPLDRGLVAGYTFRWFVLGSAFAWLALGLGIQRCWLGPAWRARPPASDPSASDPSPVSPTTVAVTASSPAAVMGTVLIEPGGGTGGVAATAEDGRASTPSAGGDVQVGLVARWLVAHPGAVAAIAVVLVVATALVPWKDQFGWSYGPGERLAGTALDATEPGGTYLVAQSGRWDLGFTPVIALALRTHGRHPVVSGTRIEALGEQYAPKGVRCDGRFVLQGAEDPRDPGVRWLDDVAVTSEGGLPARMVVGIAPDTSPAGLC